MLEPIAPEQLVTATGGTASDIRTMPDMGPTILNPQGPSPFPRPTGPTFPRPPFPPFPKPLL